MTPTIEPIGEEELARVLAYWEAWRRSEPGFGSDCAEGAANRFLGQLLDNDEAGVHVFDRILARLQAAEARVAEAERVIAFYANEWKWFPVGDEGDGVTDFGRHDGYEAEPTQALKDDQGQLAASWRSTGKGE